MEEGKSTGEAAAQEVQASTIIVLSYNTGVWIFFFLNVHVEHRKKHRKQSLRCEIMQKSWYHLLLCLHVWGTHQSC